MLTHTAEMEDTRAPSLKVGKASLVYGCGSVTGCPVFIGRRREIAVGQGPTRDSLRMVMVDCDLKVNIRVNRFPLPILRRMF